MLRAETRLCVVAHLFALTACGAPDAPVQSTLDGPFPQLTASAAEFYEQYGAALAGGQRERVAGFYHRDGATIVFDGKSRRRSYDEIREIYAAAWTPPQFFTWDDLRFDSLSTSQVLVTGGFRWQGLGDPDTTRFIYAALLVAVDSGMALVFEHETPRSMRLR